MIKITVELIPPAMTGKPKSIIAKAIIVNDGTGSDNLGNYKYGLFLKRESVWRDGNIKGFRRKQRNVWQLLSAILKKEAV